MEVANKKTAFAELAKDWPAVFVFFCLGGSPLVIIDLVGRGWGFVSAIVCLPIWFFIRPWRFKRFTEKSRRSFFIVGTVSLIILAACAGLLYLQMLHAMAMLSNTALEPTPTAP